jgi:hypothetical protein
MAGILAPTFNSETNRVVDPVGLALIEVPG